MQHHSFILTGVKNSIRRSNIPQNKNSCWNSTTSWELKPLLKTGRRKPSCHKSTKIFLCDFGRFPAWARPSAVPTGLDPQGLGRNQEKKIRETHQSTIIVHVAIKGAGGQTGSLSAADYF